MPNASNRELLARWKDEPAPLLPLLHAFHDRDGYLSEAALRFVAKEMRIPIADLFGTVTFYHHFSRDEGGLERPRVCAGPVCQAHGAAELIASLEDAGRNPMAIPCPGRCDEPVPVLQGHSVWVGDAQGNLTSRPPPLPPPPPADTTECVFAEIRSEGRAALAGYESTGGYRA